MHMIDFFYRWYTLFYKIDFMEKIKLDAINRHTCTHIANLIVPLSYRFFAKNIKNDSQKSPTNVQLVGSLTSFPDRICKLWIVIESILRQTKKVDKLILWLSKEQFPTELSLPKSLLKLRSIGLEIRLVEGDLRSHKKYYYVLKEFPEATLITFDDDIIYPSNAVKEVYDVWQKNQKCVVGRFSSQIHFDESNCIIWTRTQEDDIMTPSNNNWIGSGGVTIFPAHCFPPFVLDSNAFMEGCKYADDVWLNLMYRTMGVKSIVTRAYCPLLEVKYYTKKPSRLCDLNLGDGNRRQIAFTRSYCKLHGVDPLQNL